MTLPKIGTRTPYLNWTLIFDKGGRKDLHIGILERLSWHQYRGEPEKMWRAWLKGNLCLLYRQTWIVCAGDKLGKLVLDT